MTSIGLPEFQIAHSNYLEAVQLYLDVSSVEMIPSKFDDNRYVISVKESDLRYESSEYDSIYDRQTNTIRQQVENLWATWRNYVRELTINFPEIFDLETDD